MNRSIQKFLVHAVSAACLATAMVAVAVDPPRLPETSKADISSQRITGLDGTSHQPLLSAGQKATVLFFVLAECPIANTFAPEINRIVADFAPRGVRSYLVYADEDLSLKAARKHAQDFQFKFPALLDREHVLAKFVHASVSPEVAVLSPDNALLYRGRIDDRAAAFGKRRVQPSKRDLREALEAILGGKPVPARFTTAVGCYLTIHDKSKSLEN